MCPRTRRSSLRPLCVPLPFIFCLSSSFSCFLFLPSAFLSSLFLPLPSPFSFRFPPLPTPSHPLPLISLLQLPSSLCSPLLYSTYPQSVHHPHSFFLFLFLPYYTCGVNYISQGLCGCIMSMWCGSHYSDPGELRAIPIQGRRDSPILSSVRSSYQGYDNSSHTAYTHRDPQKNGFDPRLLHLRHLQSSTLHLSIHKPV